MRARQLSKSSSDCSRGENAAVWILRLKYFFRWKEIAACFCWTLVSFGYFFCSGFFSLCMAFPRNKNTRTASSNFSGYLCAYRHLALRQALFQDSVSGCLVEGFSWTKNNEDLPGAIILCMEVTKICRHPKSHRNDLFRLDGNQWIWEVIQ